MKPRITVSQRPDGEFEIFVNEAGRDLIVRELQGLNRKSDHFHLSYWGPDMEDQAEVPLQPIGYRPDDTVLLDGKVLFRPDDRDQQHYPHVLGEKRST